MQCDEDKSHEQENISATAFPNSLVTCNFLSESTSQHEPMDSLLFSHFTITHALKDFCLYGLEDISINMLLPPWQFFPGVGV